MVTAAAFSWIVLPVSEKNIGGRIFLSVPLIVCCGLGAGCAATIPEIPTASTVTGILIIVSSGIYIFMGEKAQEQSIVTEKALR